MATTLPVTTIDEPAKNPGPAPPNPREAISKKLSELDAQAAVATENYLNTLKSIETQQASLVLGAPVPPLPTTTIPDTHVLPVGPESWILKAPDTLGIQKLEDTYRASRLISGRAAVDAETIKLVALNFQRETSTQLNTLAVESLKKELAELTDRAKEARKKRDALKLAMDTAAKETQTEIDKFIRSLEALANVTSPAASADLRAELKAAAAVWTGGNSGQTVARALENIVNVISVKAKQLDDLAAYYQSLVAGIATTTSGEDRRRFEEAGNAAVEMAGTIESLRKRVIELEEELKNQQAVAAGENIGRAALQGEKRNADERIKKLSEENEQLRKALEECNKKGEDKDGQISRLTNEYAKFKDDAQAVFDRIDKEDKAKEARIGELEKERDNLQAKISDLTKKRPVEPTEPIEPASRKGRLPSDNERLLEEENTKLKQINADQDTRLVNAATIAETQIANIETLTKRNNELVGEYNALQTRYNELGSQATAASSSASTRISNLEKELDLAKKKQKEETDTVIALEQAAIKSNEQNKAEKLMLDRRITLYRAIISLAQATTAGPFENAVAAFGQDVDARLARLGPSEINAELSSFRRALTILVEQSRTLTFEQVEPVRSPILLLMLQNAEREDAPTPAQVADVRGLPEQTRDRLSALRVAPLSSQEPVAPPPEAAPTAPSPKKISGVRPKKSAAAVKKPAAAPNSPGTKKRASSASGTESAPEPATVTPAADQDVKQLNEQEDAREEKKPAATKPTGSLVPAATGEQDEAPTPATTIDSKKDSDDNGGATDAV